MYLDKTNINSLDPNLYLHQIVLTYRYKPPKYINQDLCFAA